MARITGKNGQIKVGGNVIAAITDWSLDLKIPLAQATAMGDTFAQNLSLIREWSGQIKGYWGSAEEQLAIMNSFFNATTAGGPTSGQIAVELFPDAAGTEKYAGNCYADFSLVVDKGKANEFTAKITGNGAIVRTA